MQKRVLIVYQDQVFNDLLGQLLQSQGYEVITAKAGTASLKASRDVVPALVILNLVRPDGEAAAMCSSVRLGGSVPMLALSPINDPHAIARLLDAGADDYLVKPVPGGVLIAHVRKLLRRTGALTPDPRAATPLTRPQTQPLHP
jgi:DNA-binding response OmpR family regulator